MKNALSVGLMLIMALTSLGYIVKGQSSPADYGALIVSVLMIAWFAFTAMRYRHAENDVSGQSGER